MKQVYKIDEQGFYVEPVILEDTDPIPVDCVDVIPPNGLYKFKWDGSQWVEGLTQVEIDSLNDIPVQASETDVIKKTLTDLTYELMLKGVL